MSRWLFLFGLGALLSAARAELPVDLPTNTPTNRSAPAISVPAPLATPTPTNAGTAVSPVLAPVPPESVPDLTPEKPWPWRCVEPPAEGTDRLTYTNGDRFAGVFLGLEDGMIRWQPAVPMAPIRFRAAGLDELTFGAQPPGNAPAPAGWLAFLADGSLLPARQVGLEEGKVVTDLAYAGKTRLDRRQVAALRRCDMAEGGYVTFGDAPSYEPAPDKSSRANERPRMRWRDAKLPDPVLLEFAWDGEPESRVNLRPFAGKGEDLGRMPVFELKVGFDGVFAHYTEYTGESQQQTLSSDLRNCLGRTVWVGLAVNRKKGEVVLYLDGMRQQFVLFDGLHNLPDFGLAVAENPPRRLIPRGVLVSRIGENLTLPVPSADRDVARLANGDQLAGRLESVSTNELVFQAAVGRMTLPLDRVAQISFPQDTNAPARAGEVRLDLFDGSYLFGVWQRADAQSVAVQNSVLGAVTIPRSAVAEVVSPGLECFGDADAADLPFLPFGLDQRPMTVGEKRLIVEQMRTMQSPAWSHLLFVFRYRPGLMQLESGMSCRGDLLGIADGIVRWRHPASPESWTVPLAAVRRLFPPARPLPESPAAERATVRLVNGDVLSGAPGADGEETVNVTPWYAGPLAIPRRHVALVTPHPVVTNALELRLTADRPWEPAPLAADGALWFESVGRSARQSGPIPDRVRLDFEVVWPPSVAPAELAGNPFAQSLVQAQVEVGDIANKRGSRFLATVSPKETKLMSSAAGVERSEFARPTDGQSNLAAGGCVNITLFADRAKRHVRLLVDGQPASERRGDDIPVPAANALRLAAGGNTGAALRHIVLREWREGQPLPPVSRPVAVSPLAPGEVRVVLHNGDFLTLGEIAADERTLTGRHKLLGSVTLNMAAVRALDGERPPPSVRVPAAKR